MLPALLSPEEGDSSGDNEESIEGTEEDSEEIDQEVGRDEVMEETTGVGVQEIVITMAELEERKEDGETETMEVIMQGGG